MLSVLGALAAASTSSGTSSTSPTSVVTESPLTEAAASCADGATICDLVTSTTGSHSAGKWAEVLVGLPLRILLIVVVAVVLRWLLHKLIRRAVESIASGKRDALTVEDPGNWFTSRASSVLEASPLAVQRRAQRARTVGTVLRSLSTGVITVVAALMVLSAVGLDIAPLLASAGIVGIAVGFGAQSLVKDFLSGMFMIIEDQYGVGDSVNLGDAVGTVESVGLRVTQVRDVNGTLWYVPNGQITRVGNQSQGWGRAVVDIAVAHGQDIARATAVMLETATAMRVDPQWSAVMVEEPEVWGVEQMAAQGVTLRVVAKTQPMEQFKVARELRQRISDAFETAHIRFPLSRATGDVASAAVLPPETSGATTPGQARTP